MLTLVGGENISVGGMRMKRIKVDLADRDAVYHCIGRVVGGEFLLGENEREVFVRMLKRYAQFSGVQVVSYCIMSNHFHLLLKFPGKEPSDRELYRRIRRFYPKKSVIRQVVELSFKNHKKIPSDLRERFLRRMRDLSLFMQELKQSFSRWYNKVHNRFGTLWSERFRSVLIQPEPEMMEKVAAYIDLNPVRAGIVEDPKDYRWCSYAEALAGGKEAREGILDVSESRSWAVAHREYRKRLFVKAGFSGQSGKAALNRNAIRRVVEEGGTLSMAELLRLRIRYFNDGVALGANDWVNGVFEEFRDRFGEKRESGARELPLRSEEVNNVAALRNLRKDAVV